MKLAKIDSGAQTGADRGGLDAAMYCNLPYGGWVPKGRLAEDGTVPGIYTELRETESQSYLTRTEANVADSDATVIFTRGKLKGGSLKTAEFARKHNRPVLHVDLASSDRSMAIEAVALWLTTDCPDSCALNVAGQRESKAPGIQREVMVMMVDIISTENRLGQYPLSDAGSVPDSEDAVPCPVEGVCTDEHDPDQDDDIPEQLRHPKTVAEAVGIVMNALTDETKHGIRMKTDRDRFLIDCHFGLTLWIRNLLIHRNRNLIDLCADFQRGGCEGKLGGSTDPDAISGAICGEIWDRLHSGT